MKNHMDNLRSANARGRLNSSLTIAVCLFVMGGLLGVPLQRLSTVETEHSNQIDAGTRLDVLRREQLSFDESGGPIALKALAHGIVGDLPSELSRTDLHGVAALLATACELDLDSLSVGDFVVIDAPHLDDAVARCDLTLTGNGSAEALSELVSVLRSLGYPTVIQRFHIRRADLQSMTFSINATLGLFQSVPVPKTTSSSPDQQVSPQ